MEPEKKPTSSSTGAEFGRQVAELVPGQKVGGGRYTLIKFLGKGGMGIVWLAQDERLGETLALKLLPAQISGDPVALDDMRRETLKSRRLTHPNIIRIHDIFESDQEPCFISMEYVDGPNLSGLRLQQPQRLFTWENLAPLVRQLCDALEYAHGEKVIHRDLKPANMMLDSRGRLKLADFGIAAVVSESMSRISLKHSTSGTVAYMSPQQMNGQRPQPSDDIYALGATLYEFLTSRPPFYQGDIIHQAQNIAPPPLATRLADLELTNEIPPAVGAMVMACLSKDPAQRPVSAGAVAEWIGLQTSAESKSKNPARDQVEAAQPVAEESAPTVLVGEDLAAGGKSKVGLWIGLGVAALVVLGLGGFLLFGNKGKNATNVKSTSTKSAGVGTSAQPDAASERRPEATTGSASRPLPTPSVDHTGFSPLFNGKDLTGWDQSYSGGAWKVSPGGLLVGDYSIQASARALNYFVDAEDFDVRFSSRFTQPGQGQLGIGFRLNPGSQQFYQLSSYADGTITLIKSLPDIRYLEVGSRTVLTARNGKDVPSVQPIFAEGQKKPLFTPTDWNQWQVRASNNVITVFLNSRPVVELVDNGVQPALEHKQFIFHLARDKSTNAVELKDIQFRPIVSVASASPATPAAKPAVASLAQLTPSANEAGFVSRFNGKDLTGWEQGQRTDWSVRSNTIVGTAGLGIFRTLNLTPQAYQDLADFELRYSVRIPAMTSSNERVAQVMFRSTPSDATYTTALSSAGRQDISRYNTPAPFSIFGRERAVARSEAGKEILAREPNIFPPLNPPLRADAWNEVTLIARGSTISLWVNGSPACELVDNGPYRLGKGTIALQVGSLQNGSATAEFKNIRIKPLPAK